MGGFPNLGMTRRRSLDFARDDIVCMCGKKKKRVVSYILAKRKAGL